MHIINYRVVQRLARVHGVHRALLCSMAFAVSLLIPLTLHHSSARSDLPPLPNSPAPPAPQAYGHHHHVYGRSARAAAARAAEEHDVAAPGGDLAAAGAAPTPAGSYAVTQPRQLGTAASPAGPAHTPQQPAAPATPHPVPHGHAAPAAATPASTTATPSSAASQPWTPLAATTPSSNGSSAFSVASTPTGPVRALWRPHVASTSPNPHHWPDTDSAGTAGGKTSARGAGGIARFSLTQVAVGGDDIGGGAVAQLEDNAAAAGDGTVQRQKHQEGNGEAAASGAAACGEGVVADAWWSLGRAMSPTGLWRRQDLPKVRGTAGRRPQAGGSPPGRCFAAAPGRITLVG